MRNTWLILRREYLERVRTRTFIVSTLLFPALIAAIFTISSKFATLKTSGTRHIVVVADDTAFARAVQWQLEQSQGLRGEGHRYQLEVITPTTEPVREELLEKVSRNQIDGFLWLDAQALNQRKVKYIARETSDFIEVRTLQVALNTALLRKQLLDRGATAEEADQYTSGMELEAVAVLRGKETRSPGPLQLVSALMLTMMLYVTLLLYGVAVMRSVVEEKTSRVMEIMLSSANARQLMAGKLLGVGAVAMTQILIWILMAALLLAPGILAARSQWAGLDFSALAFPAFALFFVLGYFLYSSMFAALGAMVNSEQEAQQWQLFVTIPIVIPVLMMTYVTRQPNAPLSIWTSLVPFFAPILMYTRIVIKTPPLWQIALCVALLMASIWGLLILCSRIYRVGILMYGKRPTLPEIWKWLRYA